MAGEILVSFTPLDGQRAASGLKTVVAHSVAMVSGRWVDSKETGLSDP